MKLRQITLGSSSKRWIKMNIEMAQKWENKIGKLFSKVLVFKIINYYEMNYQKKVVSIPLSSKENNQRLDTAFIEYIKKNFSQRRTILNYGRKYLAWDKFSYLMKKTIMSDRIAVSNWNEIIEEQLFLICLKFRTEGCL